MNKQTYQKPMLRRVRLEVKTSVLAVCNMSTVTQPKDFPLPGSCRLNGCYTPPGF